ncbi:MAG: YvcK family protein [Bacilli bacterium]|nr:YvcK family protein [Bacilli bacterium]
MKNIVVFGGGTGMSQILKGLKLFPLNVTAVVCVSDNGRSTGVLRQIYDIPAVGDISKVLLNIGNLDNDLKQLLNYRIKVSNNLNEFNHSIKNLLLTALIDIKGNLSDAVVEFCKIFNIEGSVLPLTEDNVNLIAKTTEGKIIVGEDEITEAKKTIESIWYDKEFKVNDKVIEAINSAECIIFAPGSLYTSILPHLMAPEIVNAINNSEAKKLYICNLITQPGETIGFSVSDHLKIFNKYLSNSIDTVIANKAKISKKVSNKYQTREQKYPVVYDENKINEMGIKIISDKLYTIEDNTIRHDYLKTAYLVYSYLMGDK